MKKWIIDSVVIPKAKKSNEPDIVEEMMQRYAAFEETMKKAAADDDMRHR